jgi:hypothetical protein
MFRQECALLTTGFAVSLAQRMSDFKRLCRDCEVAVGFSYERDSLAVRELQRNREIASLSSRESSGDVGQDRVGYQLQLYRATVRFVCCSPDCVVVSS